MKAHRIWRVKFLFAKALVVKGRIMGDSVALESCAAPVLKVRVFRPCPNKSTIREGKRRNRNLHGSKLLAV
jgi:hypothetical protein